MKLLPGQVWDSGYCIYMLLNKIDDYSGGGSANDLFRGYECWSVLILHNEIADKGNIENRLVNPIKHILIS